MRRYFTGLSAWLLLPALACGTSGEGAPGQSPTAGGAARPHDATVPAAVTAFIRAHAHPLSTIEPGGSRTDLPFFVNAARASRIIGLGEQSHGTHEHSRLKHRLIEALVRDAGVTAIAFEAPLLEVDDLDAWIKGGPGDPERDAAALTFWCWKTEEVLDLLRWLRAYNAAPTMARKVSLYGFDMQRTPRAVATLVAFLERVDRVRAQQARRVLATLGDPFAMDDYGTAWKSQAVAITGVLRDVRQWLAAERADTTARTSAAAWWTADRAARILEQYVEMETSEKPDGRDIAMAENLQALGEREGPDGKIAFWAHNAHVDAHVGATNDNQRTLGGELRTRLGPGYLAVGLALGDGSFRAFGVPRRVGARTRTFTVPAAPAGTFDQALILAGMDRFGLVLRDLEPGDPVTSWFDAQRPSRSLGWAFNGRPERYLDPVRPRSSFDVVFFVHQSTPTRPIARLEPEPFPIFDTPRALDFANRFDGGGDPAAWSAFGTSWDYQVSNTSGAITVTRAGSPARAEAFGGIRQGIRAAAFRGRTLRATFRTTVNAGTTGVAHVWIRANHDDAWRSTAIAFVDKAIISVGPGQQLLEMAVPQTADTLDFGLALVGDGGASLTGLTLTSVPES